MKRKVIAGILIVVGLAVMSVPLYFKITGSQKNDEMIERFEHMVEQETVTEHEEEKEDCGQEETEATISEEDAFTLEAEIRDYKKLKEIGIKMPAMLETDVKNERILKEFIDGDTIYQLILEEKMKTDYIEQLHRMCALLYASNTNIDYFPTNFVVHNEEIYYVDFECNDYMEEWNFENWGVKYWSKTPEFLQYVKEHS